MEPSGHILLSQYTQCLIRIYLQKVPVPHISRCLICDRNTAEDEGIAVVFGGSA